MKKRFWVLFFTVHLLLIFFQAVSTTIDGYTNVHFDRPPYIPVFSWLKENPFNRFYSMISGTNTGYGFYGIKTSSKKYLRCTFLDSADKVIATDRYFTLSTSNGIGRLEGYASFLANFIAESQKIEDDTLSSAKNAGVIVFRKNYALKMLKWIGRNEAVRIPHCASYAVELLTVVPKDIWTQQKHDKPEIYVIQKSIYPVR